MNLPFADLRQLAYVAAGLHDVVSRGGLCRITGEFLEAAEYRAQLRKCVEATMGSPWRGRGFALFRTASQRAVLPLSLSLDGAGR